MSRSFQDRQELTLPARPSRPRPSPHRHRPVAVHAPRATGQAWRAGRGARKPAAATTHTFSSPSRHPTTS